MRWIFTGAWFVLIISVTTFVWLTRANYSNEHVYYTQVISGHNPQSKLTVFGKVLLDKETTLVPLAEGNVSKVMVKAGDLISQGQVLALLDLDEGDLKEFDKLKKLSLDSGSMDGLNKALQEITRLEKKGFYDSLEASKKRAEIYSSMNQILAYRSSLQKQFDETHGKILKAPFGGIVTDVRLREGQHVSLKDDKSLISITVAPNGYKVGVELEVSDEILPRLKVSQRIDVSIPLSQETSFQGVIKAISNQAFDDGRRRFFKVIADVVAEQPRKKLLASGMKVVVDVTTQVESDVTWIPKAALDIHLEEKHIHSKLDLTSKASRGLASTKASDQKSDKQVNLDSQGMPSSATSSIGNSLFPRETSKTEIYILTPDNKVVQVAIHKVFESGDMVAVQGTALQGGRVITHYKPKSWQW